MMDDDEKRFWLSTLRSMVADLSEGKLPAPEPTGGYVPDGPPSPFVNALILEHLADALEIDWFTQRPGPKGMTLYQALTRNAHADDLRREVESETSEDTKPRGQSTAVRSSRSPSVTTDRRCNKRN
jgi:hypothetical protein